MKLLRQTKRNNCGQTCVAMLLNISIEEAEKIVGHDGITTENEIIKALSDYYPKTWSYNWPGSVHRRKKIDASAKYLCLHQNPKNPNQKHWTVYYNNSVFDPSGRDERELWPTIRHWLVI